MNSGAKPKEDPPGGRMIKEEQGAVKALGVQKPRQVKRAIVIGAADVAGFGNRGGSK